MSRLSTFVFTLLFVLTACGGETAVPPTLTPLPLTPTATAVPPTPTPVPPLEFDGDNAFAYLEAQMDFGPRWPGSPGHVEVGDYIAATLTDLGWQVEQQRFDYQGFEARNLIGRANVGGGPIIILGAHYDARRLADQTPGAAEAELPVPGAVDGASGVAVLLELAHTLDLDEIDREIWLAFSMWKTTAPALFPVGIGSSVPPTWRKIWPSSRKRWCWWT